MSLVPHAEQRSAVERHEQLEPLVPGGAARVLSRRVVEEFDRKREFLVQRHLVPAVGIELRRNIVRLERQPSACGEQFLPGPRRRG